MNNKYCNVVSDSKCENHCSTFCIISYVLLSANIKPISTIAINVLRKCTTLTSVPEIRKDVKVHIIIKQDGETPSITLKVLEQIKKWANYITSNNVLSCDNLSKESAAILVLQKYGPNYYNTTCNVMRYFGKTYCKMFSNNDRKFNINNCCKTDVQHRFICRNSITQWE